MQFHQNRVCTELPAANVTVLVPTICPAVVSVSSTLNVSLAVPWFTTVTLIFALELRTSQSAWLTLPMDTIRSEVDARLRTLKEEDAWRRENDEAYRRALERANTR